MTTCAAAPPDLGARRRSGELAIAAAAAAPVRHVTTAFLDALNCRAVPGEPDAGRRCWSGRPLRAVRTG